MKRGKRVADKGTETEHSSSIKRRISRSEHSFQRSKDSEMPLNVDRKQVKFELDVFA